MEFYTTGIGTMKLRSMPASLVTGFDEYVRGARQAEAWGYDAWGAAEHHFMYDGFMPLPLQALAAVAAETDRIRLVTGAMLLPLYDPIQAAELAATVDLLSGGRVTLGLGMGYRPLEFDGLGSAKKTRGARLVEGMEIIDRATRGEPFSYEGRHYHYENATLHPTPVQQPIPMWFCGGTSIPAARRAGQAGLPYWLANAPYDRIAEIADEYRRFGREAGWPEERLRVAAFKDICVGDTLAEAEMMRGLFMSGFYEEHILGYGYLVDDEGNHLYNPPVDHPLYRRFVDSIFCGTPEMVVEEMKRYEVLGVEAVFVNTPQHQIVAEQVLPEFGRGAAAARGSGA